MQASCLLRRRLARIPLAAMVLLLLVFGLSSFARESSLQPRSEASPSSFEPAAHAADLPAQPFDSFPRRWRIVTDRDQPLFPMAAAVAGDDLFLLEPTALWKVSGGKTLLESEGGTPAVAAHGQSGAPAQPPADYWPDLLPGSSPGADRSPLKAVRVGPPSRSVNGIPFQEFGCIVYCSGRHSLVILDKSGNLFEYLPQSGTWKLLRASTAGSGPDPEFIDMASLGCRVVVLDPEGNEIWRLPVSLRMRSSYFVPVPPWRIKPGDPNVSDGIAIACDGDTYVAKRSGRIARYNTATGAELAPLKCCLSRRGPRMRPSRLIAGPQAVLYMVERENNRVIAMDRRTGKLSQYVFSGDSDLRGLIAGSGRFWIIDRDRLVERTCNQPDPWKTALSFRHIDSRLDGIALPLSGVVLPSHPGVWPGARRLYRYGVHEGVDFFCDSGRVAMGTVVKAADAGKVIRSDTDFRDMDAATYARVMYQCHTQHETSEANEDRLRGCQVWIDHGNGLITRYAHLNGIRNGIKVGTYVSQGEIIGYVGVSGTGQNLPGSVKHPHLHFEIWLDGHYLGWGLTQAETLGVYEDIFGIVGRRS